MYVFFQKEYTIKDTLKYPNHTQSKPNQVDNYDILDLYKGSHNALQMFFNNNKLDK